MKGFDHPEGRASGRKSRGLSPEGGLFLVLRRTVMAWQVKEGAGGKGGQCN